MVKKLVSIIFFFSFVVSINLYAKDSRYQIPMTFFDGSSKTIAELLQEQPVYIKFWATWCRDCLAQMEHFQKVHDDYGKSLKVIGANIWVNESDDKISEIVKNFNLTFPIAKDLNGELAQAFNFIGTPYHILIDQQGNIVHSGYTADTIIDEKISLLVTGKLKSENTEDIGETKPGELDLQIAQFKEKQKTTALFFVSTWCDWYLEETRPSISKNCIETQKWINELAENYPQIGWKIVSSRLWTGEQEVREYINKYQIKIPMTLDTQNTVFMAHSIRDFPTLVIFKNGKEVGRMTNSGSFQELDAFVKSRI